MNVLIIRDDKPGHYNQTDGLLLSLKEIDKNIKVQYIDIEIKSKISRSLLKFLLNNFSFFSSKNSLGYIKYFYKKFSIPKQKPDLVISTGGNTANLNAWLARVYQSKNILNGALRGLKEDLFTSITTVIDLNYKNQIILDVAPSVIQHNKLTQKAQEFLKHNQLDSRQNYYSLLIGGNGSGYAYDDTFYNNLIEFVKQISKKDNIKWLITTSRRTPIQIEKQLQTELSLYCSYFVAYNQKEEKILSSFLGLSKKIFVTEESASMISEAITALKPVYTIYQNKTKDTNYNKILYKFQNEKKIKRVKLPQKTHVDTDFNIPKEEYSSLLAQKIKKVISHE